MAQQHQTGSTSTGSEASIGSEASSDPDSHLSSRAPAGRQEPGDHAIGHGNSVAAWTAAGVILLGALTGSFAVVFALVWLFWVAVGIIVLGGILGKVLSAMGFGEKTTPTAGEAVSRGPGN